MSAPQSVPGVDLDAEALMKLRLISAGARARRPAIFSPSGGVALRRRGRGVETFDVRPWSAGDDIRRLDRTVTARAGAPHVRTAHDERAKSVVHLVDFRPCMLFGTRRAFRSVAAAEAAIVSAWRALDLQGRVGLAAVDASGAAFFGWATNARGFAPLLDELAALHHAALADVDSFDPPLADALEAIDKAAGSATISLATGLDAPGEDFDAVAERIARRRDLDILLIADRFERAPPKGLYPYRTREGEAGTLRIGRASETPEDNRPAWLRRLGARVLEIDAGADPIEMARAVERFDGRSV